MRYHKLGDIPKKRHVVFKDENGKHRYEQLFGTEGFSGVSSLLYHIHRPTQMIRFDEPYDVSPKAAIEKNITPRLVSSMTIRMTSGGGGDGNISFTCCGSSGWGVYYQ